MRKRPATTGRPKARSRQASEVGSVPPSKTGAPDGGERNCLQNSRGQRSKIPDEDVRTRGGQGGPASPRAAVSFESDIACDAPPQAWANRDIEQPATENRRADRGSNGGARGGI